MKSWVKTSLISVLIFSVGSVTAMELDTEEKKLGYIIGMDIGKSLKGQGTTVDLDALFAAIKSSYEDGELALSEEEAASIREAYIAQRQAQASAEQAAIANANLAKAEAFLAENAVKDGIMITESGLQYSIVHQGDGPLPVAGNSVIAHYRGTLLDGTEFDSSYSRNEPFKFELDRVIPGWTEGIQLMPVGSKYMFYIKPELAYGSSGGGPIPPNSALIFEVELIGIE